MHSFFVLGENTAAHHPRGVAVVSSGRLLLKANFHCSGCNDSRPLLSGGSVSRTVDEGVSMSSNVRDGVHGGEGGCEDSLVPLEDVGFNESRHIDEIDGGLLSEFFSDFGSSSGREVCLCLRRAFGAGVLFSFSWCGMKEVLSDATFPTTGTLAALTFFPVAVCIAEASASLTFRIGVMVESLLGE